MSFCCITYRSSVGATGDGLVAAALCAAAALTNRYETYTEVRMERRDDKEEEITRRVLLVYDIISTSKRTMRIASKYTHSNEKTTGQSFLWMSCERTKSFGGFFHFVRHFF